MAAQSERQYGAFLLLHLREKGIVPPNLERRKDFRNAVVHRGMFPSKAESMAYAEDVLRLLAPLNRKLQEESPAGVAALRSARGEEIKKAGAYSAEIMTILGRATDLLPKEVTFEEELRRLDSRRRGEGGEPRGGTATSVPSSGGSWKA